MAVRISGTKKNIRWQKMAHNCYYVYQNGTGVPLKLSDSKRLPVGFNGSDIFVACGELTDEDLCIQLGKDFYSGMCISAQEKCKNTLGEWTTDGKCSCIMDLSENPTGTTDYCVPVDGAYMTDTQYSCRAGYVVDGGGTRCVAG